MIEKFTFAADSEDKTTVFHRGIPFRVSMDEKGIYQAIPYGFRITTANEWVPFSGTCSVAFLLGMVTEETEGSEWWGKSAGMWTEHHRTYIGESVGQIQIIYEDKSAEIFPVIYGVNIFSYELLDELQPNEDIFNYWGPYPEPFKSDPEAKKLLEESLVLMKNEGVQKGGSYILAVKLKEKPLDKFCYNPDLTTKATGIHITAVTGLLSGNEIDKAWRVVDPKYFWRKEYFTSCDKLARRLYQFRDEIPETIPVDQPEDYTGPRVRFEGNSSANIFGNAFAYNYHDMVTDKIDETGKTHTSSKDVPSFGTYIGIGTYRPYGPYYYHMWSRDVGRTVIETARLGEKTRTALAADQFLHYLYDRNDYYPVPQWKRLANGEENGNTNTHMKENDGHASIMLGIYNAFKTGAVNVKWLEDNRKALFDAANWFFWQIENPDKSHFEKLLYSESEASTQEYGGFDLFSNTQAYYALLAFSELFETIGDMVSAKKCSRTAAMLKTGMLEIFTLEHPRHGKMFFDTCLDVWSYEYKRFAPVFVASDISGYDVSDVDSEFVDLTNNSYDALKEEYFNPASGRQMGYGQGYITETALMLDRFEDLTPAVEYSSLYCYNSHEFNYIVPEGVIMHPTGKFWIRNSDLGNGVQQGEIMKVARLVLGLDDLNMKKGLSVIPRLPDTWTSMQAENYVIAANVDGETKGVNANYSYIREDGGYRLKLDTEQPIDVNVIRIGPFDKDKDISVGGATNMTFKRINGRKFAYCRINSRVRSLNIIAK